MVSPTPSFTNRLTNRLVEVKGMADRIITMRERLFNKLVELKTPGEWKHIKSQIGMFSFTGLKPEQVDALAEKAHIYLTRDGRISMAALNESNVEVSPSLVNGKVADEIVLRRERFEGCQGGAIDSFANSEDEVKICIAMWTDLAFCLDHYRVDYRICADLS